MTPETVKQQAAARYAVLRTLCYEESTDFWQTVSDVNGRTTAETDGHSLTRINVSRLQQMDIEEEFATLLHEVSHTGGGAGWGKGKSSHNPDFWEEFQTNATKIFSSPLAKRLVEGAFDTRKFDWHRAKYRLIQSISNVDERSETIKERKQKFADAIGYKMYSKFENSDWGVAGLYETDAARVNVFTGTERFADAYTDEQLLAFIQERGYCPLPFIEVNQPIEPDTVQIVEDSDNWSIAAFKRNESKKALAVMERLGLGYTGVAIELLNESNIEKWEDALISADLDI